VLSDDWHRTLAWSLLLLVLALFELRIIVPGVLQSGSG
jgi:hypothetical protein